MPFDLRTLKKMESLPPSAQTSGCSADDLVRVLIKLRNGSSRPPYVAQRAQFGDKIVSAEIRAGDLLRLEQDPAVESVSVSRTLPVIE